MLKSRAWRKLRVTRARSAGQLGPSVRELPVPRGIGSLAASAASALGKERVVKNAALLWVSIAVVGCASSASREPGPRPGLGVAVPTFSSVDGSHDGSIDRAEFEKLADTLFDRIDTDHNGVLSEQEYNQLLRGPPRRS